MSHKRSFDEYKAGLTHLPRPANMETAPREITPPPIQGPSAKEKKYDRQLRLWAAAGQRALEESHVLLIVGGETGSNSTVAGAETLKNLILPSIGNFTIVDGATVNNADLGVNFFLDSTSLGKSRAQEMTRLLQELNPDVKGHSVALPITQWLSDETVLRPYNLVLISAPIEPEPLERLTTYALKSSIPLVYIHSAGFTSHFSVQLPAEFPIVDTHPDPDSIQDLRLLAPWPELETAVKSLGDIEKMSDHDHGHIPYILILLYYLQIWKENHNGNYPSNFKEKTEFRDSVRSAARMDNPEGGEENFDEAAAAVLKSISPPTAGSGFRNLSTMPSCTNLTQTSANFWLIANAIHQFYAAHGVLPLPGSLPDMKATSADYIKLQNIYKSKARADVAEVTNTIRKLEDQLDRNTRPVPDSEIEQFCKNASHVRVLTNETLQSIPQLRLSQSDAKTLSSLPTVLQNWDTISPLFIAMNTPSIPKDTIDTLLSEHDPESALSKAIQETDRYQGAELHNTASVTGGMVSQEVIKLLTRQYVPVHGTCLWDGIKSKTEIIQI